MSAARRTDPRDERAHGLSHSRLWQKPLWLLLAIFAASRVCYWAMGIRFYADLYGTWQLADPPLLQERFWETLYYMHGQPPLLSFIAGVGLHIFPAQPTTFYALLFLALGLLLLISMYHVMTFLGIPAGLTTAACAIYTISPSTIMYENYFLYTYIIAALLMALMAFIARYCRQGMVRDAVLIALILSTIVLLRTSYHLVWIIGVVALVWIFAQPNRVRVLLLLPVVIAAGLYLKNNVLFGSFSTSSWMGMSWWKIVAEHYPPQDLEKLQASGELYMRALPNQPIEVYGDYQRRPEFETIPLLANTHTSTGAVNQHHYAYIEFSNRFLHDTLVLIRNCPRCYLEGITEAAHVYLRPPSHYAPADDNRKAIAPVNYLFDNLLYGRWLPRLLFGRSVWGDSTFPVLFFGIPASIITGVWFAVRAFRRHEPVAPVLGVAALTCVFLTIPYITLEIDENHKYRYEIDPLIFTLGTYMVWRLLVYIRARWNKSRYAVEPQAAI